MALPAGTKLSHYEIVEPIGKGGMGEVYRAHDTKLGRQVAIKVLPEEFASDQERFARFEREAKVLASLNHPGIAAIYGLEAANATHFLVLELVEGETLAERIARGPIPLNEALDIAAKIVEALEEAHERGIVHRDLKPANIKITPDDKVKVLDFGLAKAFAEETPESDSSMSPTLTRDQTRAGVILGTAAYMSPEQAKGKRVDKRTDIFAFGAVLYEMLTGKKAFPGDDVSEVLAAVIKLEPDWKALPPKVDPRLEKLLKRCLDKDPKNRCRDIGDARLEIVETVASPESGATPLERTRKATIAAAVAGLLVGVAVTALMWPPSPPPPVTHLSVSAEGLTLRSRHGVAISPDGRTLAFTRNGKLNVRPLDRPDTVELPGTDGARSLVFSPDGQWIAFESDGLKKVPIAGGTPVEITPESRQHGISWVNDTIYFAEWTSGPGRIVRISANGGEPEVMVEPEETERLYYPRPLPDGRTLIFTVVRSGEPSPSVVSQSLDTGERRVLVEEGSDARYLPSGHLVYRVGSTLQAARFDLAALQVIGPAVTVVEEVAPVLGGGDRGGAHYAISDNGTLVCLSGNSGYARLSWFDRQGNGEPLDLPPALYNNTRLSLDGSALATEMEEDIWIYDIARGARTRLTFTADNNWPIWTPDGKAIVFASGRHGTDQIFWKPADGSSAAEQLTTGDFDRHPDAISPDGSILVFHEHHPDRGRDLGILEMDGKRETRSFLATEFDESGADVSPDGRWLAYISDESGELEVFVRPFPNAGAKHINSTDGGGSPVWSPDGRELFYREGNRVMAVPVELGDDITVGKPEPLFETNFYSWVLTVNTLGVAADGKHFLLAESNALDRGELQVVLNWFEELDRLVPAN